MEAIDDPAPSSAIEGRTIDVIELPKLDEREDAASIGKLAEIAENLHRREISALERSELQAAWVEIVQARKETPDVSAEVRPKLSARGRPEGRTPSGINKAARELGVPRSTLQQSVKIAKLSPEAKAEARKLKLDNNQEALLTAAKKVSPAAQVAALEQRTAPKPKVTRVPSARQVDQGAAAIQSVWNGCCEKGRRLFVKNNVEAIAQFLNGDGQ